MRLLRRAWNSVSEVTIQNCFKKANFVRLKDEDNIEETENNGDRDVDGIWERLQACGLIPETYDFTENSESDANVITCETVSEGSILHDLEATAEIVQEEGDDDDDDSNPVEAALTPVEALTSMRELDRYLRSHNDSEEMLNFLAKTEHYVVNKSISKAKQLKIYDFFAKK